MMGAYTMVIIYKYTGRIYIIFTILSLCNSWYNFTEVETWLSVKHKSEQLQNGKKKRWKFRVPKGERAVIQAHANQQGESTTAFIKRAIKETMERDNAEKSE